MLCFDTTDGWIDSFCTAQATQQNDQQKQGTSCLRLAPIIPNWII